MLVKFYLTFFLIAEIFILIMYYFSTKIKKADLADFGWVILVFAAVLFSIIDSGNFNFANMILFALIAIWTIKLGSRILTRIINSNKEDSRYAFYRSKWGSTAWYKFVAIFMLQPVFALLLTIPFVLASYYGASVSIPGVIVCLVGILGTYISDLQLSNFKKKANSNQVLNTGLWAYSRHPNYFFEWITWCGYVLFLANNQYFILALLSPITMYGLLVYGTGIPPLEHVAVKNKGEEYINYQKTTNKFFLGVKKK